MKETLYNKNKRIKILRELGVTNYELYEEGLLSRVPDCYWTKERFKILNIQDLTRGEFIKRFRKEFRWLHKNRRDLLDKFFPPTKLGKSKKNKEILISLARLNKERPVNNYLGLTRYTSKSSTSYDSRFDNIIRELAPNWFLIKNAPIYKDECLHTAKQFNHIIDWKNKHLGHYNKARKKMWIDECTSHMTRLVRKKLSDFEITNIAKSCKNLTEFRTKDNSAYVTACSRGLDINFLKRADRSKIIGKNQRCVINLDTGLILPSAAKQGLKYNVLSGCITACCKGRQKTAGGCKWAYFDEWFDKLEEEWK